MAPVNCNNNEQNRSHSITSLAGAGVTKQRRARRYENNLDACAININPRWLSVTQACRYCAMSDKTLMRHIINGDIYGTKKGGKWYIDRDSIDAFMLADDVFVKETLERLRKVM